MAAVVRTVLGKRGKNGRHEDEDGDVRLGYGPSHLLTSPEGMTANDAIDDGEESMDDAYADIPSAESSHESPGKNSSMPRTERRIPDGPKRKAEFKQIVNATLFIQRWYRGVKVRLMFKTAFARAVMISPRAVNKILYRVVFTHNGWSRFLLHLAFMGMFVAMVITQIFYVSPSSPDVNKSLINFMRSSGIDPSFQVTRSQQVFDYIEALLPHFAAATNPETFPLEEIPLTDVCQENFAQNCGVRNMTNFTMVLSECLNNHTRYNDGYLDNQNRLQFGLFLTQRRYNTTKCKSSVQEKNPLKNLPKHACLNAQSQVSIYESEICGSPTNPIPNANCYAFPEFRYNNVTQTFTMLMAAGNMGEYYGLNETVCRLNQMRKLGWLDYRSKEACLYFFTFNENQNGRLAVFRNCFEFTLGGKVIFRTDVASSSMSEDDVTIQAVTGTFAAVLIIWALWEMWDMYRYYRQCWHRVPRCGDVSAVALLVLSIVNLAIFFPMYYQATNFVYMGTGDLTQFASTDEFWTAMTKFLRSIQNWQRYNILLAFTMFFFILRTLIVLDFHPSLGIVTGTLRTGVKELLSFLLVFVIILICYGCLGMVFFGGNNPQFSNLGYAMMSLIFMSLMQLEDLAALVLDPTISVGSFETSNWIVVVWYYSFLVLVSILLLNVLLSIVVGAFVDFQERRREDIHNFSLVASFFVSCSIWKRFIVGVATKTFSFCRCRRKCQQEAKTESVRTERDEEHGKSIGRTITTATPCPDLDPRDVVFSLNQIRKRYQSSSVTGIDMRRSLSVLFDAPSVIEKLISEMRQMSIREGYTAELLSYKAKHFKEEQYKGHMLAMIEKLVNHTNAAALAASAKRPRMGGIHHIIPNHNELSETNPVHDESNH